MGEYVSLLFHYKQYFIVMETPCMHRRQLGLITGLLALSLLIIGYFATVPATSAQTAPELQVTVTELQAQLALLQAVVISPAATSTNPFRLGATITTTAVIRVRSGAGTNAPFIASQPAGVHGVIVEGPVALDGYNWFKIDYATGVDGWTAGPWLRELTDLPDLVGTLIGYADGVKFVTTTNSTRANALLACEAAAVKNQKAQIRCTWRGVQIYDSALVKSTPNVVETVVAADGLSVTTTFLFAAPATGTLGSKTPVRLGTIDWGDGTDVASSGGTDVEPVSEVVRNTLVTVRRKHIYRSNGIYTITATGLDGKTSVKMFSFTTLPTPPVQYGTSITWGDEINLVTPTIGSSTSGGTYPRMVKVASGTSTGDLLLFYQSGFYGGTIWMQRSRDGGHVWLPAEPVSVPGNSFVYANCNVDSTRRRSVTYDAAASSQRCDK